MTIFNIQLEGYYFDVDRALMLSVFLFYYIPLQSKQSLARSTFIIILGFTESILLSAFLSVEFVLPKLFILFFLTSMVEEIIRAFIIDFVRGFLEFNKSITILITGLLFALVHKEFYDFDLYSILVLIMGILFSTAYFMMKKSFDSIFAVSVLTSVHMLLIVFYAAPHSYIP